MARILLIDDTAADRRAIQAALEDKGHLVEVAEDGPTGVRAHRDAPFDLVLLDLAAPRAGSAALVNFVSEFPDVRIVVTARRGDTISARAYLEIAAAARTVRSLPKPFTAARLHHAVRVMVNGGEWRSAVGDGDEPSPQQ